MQVLWQVIWLNIFLRLMSMYDMLIGFIGHLGSNYSFCWKSANHSPGSYI